VVIVIIITSSSWFGTSFIIAVHNFDRYIRIIVVKYFGIMILDNFIEKFMGD